MTPAARISAAIDILDEIIDGALADRSLTGWGRRNRFAGGGDRRAIADLVYAALRRRRSLGWRAGDSGRGLMLALADETGRLALFSGARHAAAPPTADERAKLVLQGPLQAAVALDCPPGLEDALRLSLGPRFVAVMQALQARAPVHVRVNMLKTARSKAIADLAAEGIVAEPLAEDPDALHVTEGARRLRQAQAFARGFVEVQDLSSQRVARFAAARPGETVLDYCAGGGGKTLALAAHMKGEGRLFAHDAAPQRMDELERRAARAGAAISLCRPGSLPMDCDLVLVDAPCSGSGAWRRNPDAKWRLDAGALASFQQRQDAVLDAAARHVGPSGRLVYATCSLLAEENAARVTSFLARHPRFRPGATMTLTPDGPGDGFFAAWVDNSSSG